MPNGGSDPNYASDMDHEYVIKPMQEQFRKIRTLVERFRRSYPQHNEALSAKVEALLTAIEDALGDEGRPAEWHKEQFARAQRAEQEARDRREYERLKKKYSS